MKRFEDVANRIDGVAEVVWKFGWGLMFVAAMTVLSEWGPPMGYSKPSAPLTQVANVSFVRCIK